MKTFLITCLGLFITLSACGGREMVPDCSYEGPGSTYCRWDSDDLPYGHPVETCCPSDHPYCGVRGTNCPAGKCCNAPPR